MSASVPPHAAVPSIERAPADDARRSIPDLARTDARVGAPAPTQAAVQPYDFSWLRGLLGAPIGVIVALVVFWPVRVALGYALGSAAAALVALMVGMGAGGVAFWVAVARPWRKLPPPGGR